MLQRCGVLMQLVLLMLGLGMMLAGPSARAQTGGEAGIQGSVIDSTGATVSNATVTATNDATGVSTTRQSSSAGLYTISPIVPGTYTVTATAQGFESFKQNNFVIDALHLTGLNITMTIGSATEQVTVTGAPPALDTTNAVLGGVMENKTYENLPLQMSGQQRDPTAFAALLPGVQGGSRAPVIGGTGNYLAAVYVDGIPVTTINQQGDNRVVSNAIPVEAIDQFQVVTSTPGAEYQGAGLINFTLKSGSDAYHGTAAIFVRNTIFDTWGFSPPALTSKDASGNTIPAVKPVEHQNEIVGAVGGPIPFTKKKGFFYASYDRYHGRSGINPNVLTVPTALMRQGNFSELLSLPKPIKIYDPTSTGACTAANGGQLCRSAYANNVIPGNELSPIALKMQSYLPAPTNPGLTGNYLGGVPSGYDNQEVSARVDFDITQKQRISYVLTTGIRKNVPFTVGGSPAGVVLPLPYTAGGYATIKPTIMDVEHNYQISPNVGNQFKFGFNRFSQPVESLTDGVAPYRAAADIGITGLPTGQASTEFPGASFGTTSLFSTAETPWTSNGASGATQTTVPNTFTLLDNLLAVKGQHALTIGLQIQWLQDNVAGQLGPSGILTIPYSANSTAPYTGTSLNPSTGGGFAYASYLLGAAGQTGVGIQQVSETGGRYRDISPYIQDDWKVSPKLTVNLGLRWDYFPPFHEVEDRWSFLNPNLINAATGNKGALQFAGNRGAGVSCQCQTPVQSWFKNFGPRIGLAYSATPNTVLRAGYALVYSIGGGVGGRAGAGNGTGSLGFNTTATTPTEQTTGANAGPSFYLNNSAAFTGLGSANFGGPGFTLPGVPTISAASQILNTGNYETAAGKYATAATIAYADPRLSGRAPEFDFFNAGIQQALSQNLTLSLNYAGTQSHFVNPSGQNARGYFTNELNPTLLATLGPLLGSDGATPLLTSKTTPANLAILQKALPGYSPAYATLFANNSTASIAQALVAFPQYSGVSDTWGANVANISYNSLQASLSERISNGVTFTVNYTWSKNIGDDGTFRSGYALPSGATSNGRSYKANAIERGETDVNIPQNINIYGVYELPFGKSGFGKDNYLVRTLAGGWQLSNIYSYTSGTPLIFTYAGCTAPNEGQCMPDLNPNYAGNARINGKFGKGITAAHLTAIQYIDPAAFQAPSNFTPVGATGKVASPISKIGTAPRTAAYGIHNEASYHLDLSLRRTFNLTPQRFRMVLEADGLNITNHPVFGNINTAVGSTTFGTVSSVSGNRDFQFAGRINF